MAEIDNVVDSLLKGYKTQLANVMSDHEKMLEKSKTELSKLIEKSNKDITDLTNKLNQQTQDAQNEVDAEQAKPIEPVPETAWVDGHLVLNPQAIAVIDKMFTLLKDLLPEIAEAVKR